ncbi:hypothetical protein GALL_428640 [mine drainage metagenome]|uniref:Uncharacterized protein n=1 Tax=mine drainage metagenome TaxID=410659 RepID=A0A1J5QHK0_9ZZZZ
MNPGRGQMHKRHFILSIIGLTQSQGERLDFWAPIRATVGLWHMCVVAVRHFEQDANFFPTPKFMRRLRVEVSSVPWAQNAGLQRGQRGNHGYKVL